MFFKVDDSIQDGPNLGDLSHIAIGVYVDGLAYCSRHLTDGNLPKSAVAAQGARRKTRTLWTHCEHIVTSGLWTDHGDFYTVDKYLDHNQSRSQVLELRSEARRRRDVRANVGQKLLVDKTRQDIDKKEPMSIAYGEDFNAVWDLYPRKTAKGQSLKAYTTQRRKGTTADELLTAAQNYLKSRAGQDATFTMQASRFFGPTDEWREWLEAKADALPVFKPSPLDGMVAAQRRRAEEDDARRQAEDGPPMSEEHKTQLKAAVRDSMRKAPDA